MTDSRLTAVGVARDILFPHIQRDSTGKEVIEAKAVRIRAYGNQRAAEARKAAMEEAIKLAEVARNEYMAKANKAMIEDNPEFAVAWEKYSKGATEVKRRIRQLAGGREGNS